MGHPNTAMLTETLTARTLRRLADLGPTADAVADKLRALGIKGCRDRAGACPLATYLLRDDLVRTVAVGDNTISVWPASGPFHTITTPDPVSKFIQNFDSGIYLDLVDLTAEAVDSEDTL